MHAALGVVSKAHPVLAVAHGAYTAYKFAKDLSGDGKESESSKIALQDSPGKEVSDARLLVQRVKSLPGADQSNDSSMREQVRERA